ncbi:UbiA prenyltransferase family-domain-containing protein [Crepidotus variabilis]|uniref:UbiA prenyltransferase family-domain-containing protein n=1 Tax=Crepidotus variabilis TaxID=179855 RepID=A0A9P6ELA1_9AGAR|nr:UbiA prenyltransferase family-domain-containing protein [Crepidotus variabilis]
MKSEETTRLLPSNAQKERLKFPLGLVSPTVRPYLELIRFEKPTGTILMFWPFAWGLTMAAYREQLPLDVYAFDLVKCLFSAFIVRSSACTINDIFDRKMDAAQAERCRTRPLASGRISVFAATTYLLVQYAIGIVFFYANLRDLAFAHSLHSFMIYPLLKRCTHWPQAWLGLAMNFGLIASWVAITGSLDSKVIGAGVTSCWGWTMLYDTIYACQDIKDDIKVGVRSTAILWGAWIRPLLVGCGLMFLAFFALAGYLNNQGPAFFVASIGGLAFHLIYQYCTVDLEVPKSCGDNFIGNGRMGAIIWAGLMLDYLHSLGKF